MHRFVVTFDLVLRFLLCNKCNTQIVYVCVRAQEDVEFEVKVLKVDKSNGVASVNGWNKKSGKAALQGRVTMSFEPTSKL